MIINKELALIAERKGFRESNNFTRYYLSLEGDNELYLKQGKQIIHLAQWVIAPESETLLDWIFSEIGLESNPNTHLEHEVKHLEFWYNTLIEHKFTLMGEFISRLEEWFSTQMYLDASYRIQKVPNAFLILWEGHTRANRIKQCFTLLKEEYVA